MLMTTIFDAMTAMASGEDCHYVLHDALLEAGRPNLASHFKEPFNIGHNNSLMGLVKLRAVYGKDIPLLPVKLRLINSWVYFDNLREFQPAAGSYVEPLRGYMYGDARSDEDINMLSIMFYLYDVNTTLVFRDGFPYLATGAKTRDELFKDDVTQNDVRRYMLSLSLAAGRFPNRRRTCDPGYSCGDREYNRWVRCRIETAMAGDAPFL